MENFRINERKYAPKYSLGYDDKKFFRSESLYHLGFYQWQVDEVIMKQLD